MSSLEVDAVGLHMLAAHCQAWAAEVRTAHAPQSCEMSFQATAFAVDAIDTGADSAGDALARRLTSTAAELTAASVSYSSNDKESAVPIHAASAEI